ncbi:hypothetical protein [Aliiroseovarius sp. YM-037]|uniref:hypothetical protein n=1 Tax=Aliiroseovarius sp. YM-037 TaxID=3341728 RepID=UPI003A7F9E96
MSETIEIYVYLEDEGVDVWRPTTAKPLGNGRFMLLATPDYDPGFERWEFVPGSVVSCRTKRFQGEQEQKLIAVSAD